MPRQKITFTAKKWLIFFAFKQKIAAFWQLL
jgi:hypothetical protein